MALVFYWLETKSYKSALFSAFVLTQPWLWFHFHLFWNDSCLWDLWCLSLVCLTSCGNILLPLVWWCSLSFHYIAILILHNVIFLFCTHNMCRTSVSPERGIPCPEVTFFLFFPLKGFPDQNSCSEASRFACCEDFVFCFVRVYSTYCILTKLTRPKCCW